MTLHFSEITQSRVFNGAKLESEHCFPRFCPVLWALGGENREAGSISGLTEGIIDRILPREYKIE